MSETNNENNNDNDTMTNEEESSSPPRQNNNTNANNNTTQSTPESNRNPSSPGQMNDNDSTPTQTTTTSTGPTVTGTGTGTGTIPPSTPARNQDEMTQSIAGTPISTLRDDDDDHNHHSVPSTPLRPRDLAPSHVPVPVHARDASNSNSRNSTPGQSVPSTPQQRGDEDVPMTPVSGYNSFLGSLGGSLRGSEARRGHSSARRRIGLGDDDVRPRGRLAAGVGTGDAQSTVHVEDQEDDVGEEMRNVVMEGGGGEGEEVMEPQEHDHDNDDEEEEEEGEPTLIRGTDIHVQTAAKAFKDFIQNFISLEESEKILKQKERMRRRARQQTSTNDNDGDDDSDISSTSEESDSSSTLPKVPFYTNKLRSILLGTHKLEALHSSSANNESSQTLTSSIAVETTASLDLNTLHLYYHSPQCQRLYHQLISYPAEVVPLMDLIVSRHLESLLHTLHAEASACTTDEEAFTYAALQPLSTPLPRIQVRPYHLKTLSHMRSLDPNAIDNLLSIRGMVVRTSPIIPDLKVAHFRCTICSHSTTITMERGRISEPTLCPTCNIKNGYELIHNRSLFADKQMVRIQETPDEVPAGETPASIVLFGYDDLVDAVRPGDRVEVTGVFRAQAKRVNPKITRVKSVYRTYVDVIHFRRIVGSGHASHGNAKSGNDEQGKGIHSTSESLEGRLSKERIAVLNDLAKAPNIYERLVQSLAPSIWELDDVKKGVLCMLFGGNSKRVRKGTEDKRRKRKRKDGDPDNEYGPPDDNNDDDEIDDELSEEDEAGGADTAKLHKRGDINILLCGDPGTSKSQLLSYVHKLSPRGVYTSGKGSSAVGLTASIVRDPETRDLVMESGALVLSDLGICCIDEFDKMSDTTRAILHEAMEQQTVSIAKAGIIATLNARTSILASANPVESRYNPQISVVENIKLPPTLLSRFDLIYLILDSPNVDNDRRLAQHLVGLYYDTPNVVQPPLDHDLLRDYIAYARDNIHPELSDLATRELISAYLDMRRMGSGGGNNGKSTISATPRQLESLIRLSEALAKMRYSRIVTRADVKEAVRLMRVATQAAATDPRTGRIDMDMIATGRSTSNREMEESLNMSLKELLAERRGNRMAVSDVRRQLSEIMNVTSLQQDEVVDALRRMEADGLIQFNERAQTIFVRAGIIN